MKFVTIKRFAEISGYTEDAIRAKIKKGVWLNKLHWVKSRDGRIHINVEAIDRWIQG